MSRGTPHQRDACGTRHRVWAARNVVRRRAWDAKLTPPRRVRHAAGSDASLPTAVVTEPNYTSRRWRPWNIVSVYSADNVLGVFPQRLVEIAIYPRVTMHTFDFFSPCTTTPVRFKTLIMRSLRLKHAFCRRRVARLPVNVPLRNN